MELPRSDQTMVKGLVCSFSTILALMSALFGINGLEEMCFFFRRRFLTRVI